MSISQDRKALVITNPLLFNKNINKFWKEFKTKLQNM